MPAEVAEVDPIQAEWDRRTARAVQVIDDALNAPAKVDEDEYRAHRVRLLAADRVLGFRKGSLPLPSPQALGVREVTVKDGKRTIRMRWAGGGEVRMPLTPPAQLPGHDPEEE